MDDPWYKRKLVEDIPSDEMYAAMEESDVEDAEILSSDSDEESEKGELSDDGCDGANEGENVQWASEGESGSEGSDGESESSTVGEERSCSE